MPTFREIGAFLKEKYDSAIEVRYQRRLGKLRSRDRRFAGPTKDDLIYFEKVIIPYENMFKKSAIVNLYGVVLYNVKHAKNLLKFMSANRISLF